MVVEVDLGLGGDEDLELGRLRDVDGHPVVEGVDALDDDGLAALDVERPARDGLAGLEVELRQCDGLPGDEVDHVLVEKRDVERLDGLEVDLPVLPLRDLVLLEVIVVDRDADRVDSAGEQFDAEAVGEGGLARA